MQKHITNSTIVDDDTFPSIDFLPHFFRHPNSRTLADRRFTMTMTVVAVDTNATSTSGHRVSIVDEITLVFSNQRSPTNVCWHLLLSSRSQRGMAGSHDPRGLLSNSNGKRVLFSKNKTKFADRKYAGRYDWPFVTCCGNSDRKNLGRICVSVIGNAHIRLCLGVSLWDANAYYLDSNEI